MIWWVPQTRCLVSNKDKVTSKYFIELPDGPWHAGSFLSSQIDNQFQQAKGFLNAVIEIIVFCQVDHQYHDNVLD